jgi:orotate phosphoribosyltransferase
MNRTELMDYLVETKAMLKGHFLLSSGLHSDTYIQCAQLLKEPQIAEKFCAALAELFTDEKPEIVVGPALGGVIVAYETARQLGVPGIFAERENGIMKLRRGFTIEKGQKVLITEDVITTGGSSEEVVQLLNELGAEVIGVGSIIDRSAGQKIKLSVPFKSLLKLEIKAFEPENCSLCVEGSKAIKPGSRN